MRRAGLALLIALAAPASASAQTPPPAPTPVPPAPTPAPAPAAVKLATSTLDTFDKTRAAWVGRSFTARVSMTPYVANETAIIRVYRGKKKIAVKTLQFTAVNNGAAGVATFKVKSGKPGSLAIKVDRTAPVTTARINGAAPVAEYFGPVRIALTRTDGDGSGAVATEYRVGDGAWTPYTGAE